LVGGQLEFFCLNQDNQD